MTLRTTIKLRWKTYINRQAKLRLQRVGSILVIYQSDDHQEDDTEPDFQVNYVVQKSTNQFESLKIQEGKSAKKLDKGKASTVAI